MSRMSSRSYRARHAAPKVRRTGRIALTAVGTVPAVVGSTASIMHHRATAQAEAAPQAAAAPAYNAKDNAAVGANRAESSLVRHEVGQRVQARAVARAQAAEAKAAAHRQAVRAQAKKAARAKAKAAAMAKMQPQRIATIMLAQRGWGRGQAQCLAKLWTRESSWQVNADNPTSDAYGIPQALPGNRMASAGADWRTNPATQIKWGLGYISDRYGTPCNAWAHETAIGWY